MLGDNYITVHQWKQGFDHRTNEIKKTLVWMQLPDLPIEFYHPEAVLRIAQRAGTPVRVDKSTETGARDKYARVCIEVDLTKPLLSAYKIEGVEYYPQNEGLKNICFECGTYGHSQAVCPTVHKPDPTTPQTPVEPTQSAHTELYGEWMVAKPSQQKQSRKPANPSQPPVQERQANRTPPPPRSSGSRFAILEEEELPATSPSPSNKTPPNSRPPSHPQHPRPSKSNNTQQTIWVEKPKISDNTAHAPNRNLDSTQPMNPVTEQDPALSSPKKATITSPPHVHESPSTTLQTPIETPPPPNVVESSSPVVTAQVPSSKPPTTPPEAIVPVSSVGKQGLVSTDRRALDKSAPDHTQDEAPPGSVPDL
ncbi:unnamed protein product [Linum tenue]|uniref:CCHC-type domain-containing protein n=1 Tax=Linum tenue TaxID=586396 RepID=A0AAV0RS01_9ROSI|nr:unnamed protein product [Linum tenue]